MANFIYPPERNYVSTIQFATLAENAINQFECVDGKRAGFRLQKIKDYEADKFLVISHIYDCTNGDVVYLTALNVQPETDLVGGLFTSGVFPNGEIFDAYTKFQKV